MNIFKYLKINHKEIYDKILYFLNSDQCIVFGGFVKYILINKDWNNELDVLCYDYENIYKDFIIKFPPDSIEEKNVHIILNYKNHKIDLCKPFTTNDFSFNSLGIIGENIVIIPTIFGDDIKYFLNQLDTKTGVGGKYLTNAILRKEKYKDWEIFI